MRDNILQQNLRKAWEVAVCEAHMAQVILGWTAPEAVTPALDGSLQMHSGFSSLCRFSADVASVITGRSKSLACGPLSGPAWLEHNHLLVYTEITWQQLQQRLTFKDFSVLFCWECVARKVCSLQHVMWQTYIFWITSCQTPTHCF